MKNLIFPVLLGLGLVGCAQSAKDEQVETGPQTVASQQQNEPAAGPATTQGTNVLAAASSGAAALPSPAAPARTVVYEGKMELAVNNFERASTGIDSLLNAHGAYLNDAHETRHDGRPHQQMTIKVPPAHFAPLVAALGKLGRVENKDVASADVTADILAASTTLADQQTAQAKYQQLLTKTTDAKQVQHLLEQARQAQANATAAQARLQAFGAQRAWATLALHYYQLLPSPEPSEPLPAFAPQFLESFNRGWSVVLSVLVWLTNLWPLVLLAGAAVAGLRWWHRRSQLPA
ncbi:DUF4349 domain-containing protein [Hymenobacter properus]|uniref:DUF4349 domain-containing protein n=1 Tax=Hymenobacter properus TaxID=2791026 RepID=A0A931BMF6_9BACT|nr:DUF4349 domain-containing protein [Hymenobacter properus]MBF9144011.1 DUF4349 domain-containing protein [Hymenobacter properus]MBR7722828.1 DUF4349 domain-containing protein [Microvirga sp. SRT04]